MKFLVSEFVDGYRDVLVKHNGVMVRERVEMDNATYFPVWIIEIDTLQQLKALIDDLEPLAEAEGYEISISMSPYSDEPSIEHDASLEIVWIYDGS